VISDQSSDEFADLLAGRTLRLATGLPVHSTKSGRVGGFALQDVATGEVIAFVTVMGAIEAKVLFEADATGTD
jgi:hypothetical protein